MTSKYHKHLLLTFDAFNTLFTPRAPIAQVYIQHGNTYGIDCGDPEDPQTQSKMTHQFRHAFHKQAMAWPNYGRQNSVTVKQWWSAVIAATYRPYLNARNQPAVSPDLVDTLMHHFSSGKGYRLFPDVRTFFENLRDARLAADRFLNYQSVTVGVITNSDPRTQGILQSLGFKIGPYRIGHVVSLSEDSPQEVYDLDFIVSSYHAMVEKPDPELFITARDVARDILNLREIKWKLHGLDLVHVGDDMKKDVMGAQNAQWRPVHLCRESAEKYCDDVERITSLDQLPGLLSLRD